MLSLSGIHTFESAAAAADGWGSIEMLEDTVFESEDLTELMDTLSHSDESESVTGSVSSPQEKKKTTLETDVTTGTVNPSTKPSRKRRKHELDNLRSLATALESKLASIKEVNDVEEKQGTKHYWKRISDQLLVEKQKAMGENARLREILKDQIKVVKSLQRSLAKSPDLNVRFAPLLLFCTLFCGHHQRCVSVCLVHHRN